MYCSTELEDYHVDKKIATHERHLYIELAKWRHQIRFTSMDTRVSTQLIKGDYCQAF